VHFTYNLGGNPLDWHDPENIPHDIQSTLLATNKFVRLLGDQGLGVFVEERSDGVDLFRGLRQRFEHLPLFPLSPFGSVSGKEEPWTADDLGDPVQEWVPELLLLVRKNARDFAILLELESTAGTPGSGGVVLVLLIQLRKDLTHGFGSHEREPGVGAVLSELAGEGTKEESTEHGTESRGFRGPHAIGITPGGEIVRGEIGREETISANKSDGIGEDGTGDGVTGAKTSTCDNWFGVLGLETNIQLEMVDCTIKFLGGGSNLRVGVPFQERLVSFQAEVLRKRKKLGMRDMNRMS